MDESNPTYLNIDQFQSLTGLSKSTIHRLKDAGTIPVYQPGGKGSRLLFPADALERSARLYGQAAPASLARRTRQAELSGPQPQWMRPHQPR